MPSMPPVCQGPRDTVNKPKFAVPAGACDCHSHILGPVTRFPYAADRSYTPPDASAENFTAMLGALGFERGIVVQASAYGSDNSRVVAAIDELGQHRARGVVMVGHAVQEEELRRLHAAGMRATRFITTARGGPSIEQLPKVAEKVAALGWHIEMYVPPADWEWLLPIVSRLPVPVVFDHMAGLPAGTGENDPRLRAILGLLEEGRAWVKLCGYRNSLTGFPYDDVAGLARIFVARAPDRCVWGSDWPHTTITGRMPDDGELLDLLADWVPDPAVREKILVSNPARLYGFEQEESA